MIDIFEIKTIFLDFEYLAYSTWRINDRNSLCGTVSLLFTYMDAARMQGK